MRTLFLCANNATTISRHMDEEYDRILYVNPAISTNDCSEWISRVRDAVRLAHSDRPEDPDKRVSITIDAPSPYYWMAQQLQIEMKENERIEIVVPSVQIPPDPDIMKEVNKLDAKSQNP